MIKNILAKILFIAFCSLILFMGIRGIPGNLGAEDLNKSFWRDEGPFELSPERGRFALTYSFIENHSFSFSTPIARFATPDLGYSNGNYVSLFAPGISFLVIPGYLLGKTLGLAQVGTFAVISLFAVLNALLIRTIATRLGANNLAANISALIFLFATPAFTYAVSLFQHHVSTFLILLAAYVLIKTKRLWSLLAIWFLIAASIPIDYPNLFLMLPIGLFALGRFILLKTEEHSIKINVKLLGFITFIGAALPLAFFLWFNKMSYNNPLQISGTVSSVKDIDEFGRPKAPENVGTDKIELYQNPQQQDKSAVRFFKTRNILHGLSIHFISPDRGIIFYTPIILIGILGLPYLYRTNQRIFALLIGIVAMDVALYSMWGDPYGGWAFGSRYLVPSYAIMAIFISIALTHLRKNLVFLVLFFLFAMYSVAVNTLGAVTTNRIPPKVEAVALEKISGRKEYYTYQRNWEFLMSNKSKSFIFQSFAGYHMSAFEYYLIITTSISVVILAMIFVLYLKKERGNYA